MQSSGLASTPDTVQLKATKEDREVDEKDEGRVGYISPVIAEMSGRLTDSAPVVAVVAGGTCHVSLVSSAPDDCLHCNGGVERHHGQVFQAQSSSMILCIPALRAHSCMIASIFCSLPR